MACVAKQYAAVEREAPTLLNRQTSIGDAIGHTQPLLIGSCAARRGYRSRPQPQ